MPAATPAPRSTGGAVDLRGPDRWVAVGAALSVGCATAAGARHFGLPVTLTFAAGAVVGLLAVVALPSIPTRLATPLVIASGGFVLTRYARSGAVSSLTIIAWAFATLATFVALERSERARRPRLSAARGDRAMMPVIVVGGVVVSVLALVLWPVMAVGSASNQRGEPADPFAASSSANLRDVGVMDTRGRPRLGDEVVMYVTADRPAFWRGATFDTWDGTAWFRTDDSTVSLLPGSDDKLRSAIPAGLGAVTDRSRLNEQTYELVAPNVEVLFAAPEAVELQSDHLAAVRHDGTLSATFDPLGRGARYTVVSAEPNATEATLRRAQGALPPEIATRYAQPATATERVRELARRITEDAPTTYEKVRAIEAWLDANVEYSLDAPLPSRNVSDVVDWFVFDGRRGWCEQIASTLVVMLRELGIPARVATGFVTGDFDPLTGRYVVRAKHAHAWAEVWFPGVGWQGFDPTASVPLAGESTASPSVFTWVQANIWFLGVALIVGVAGGFGFRSIRDRFERVGRLRRRSWATRVLDDLERVGAATERPRRRGETPTRYAAALAERLECAALVDVGAAIDADAFGPVAVTDEDRRRVEALVRALV